MPVTDLTQTPPPGELATVSDRDPGCPSAVGGYRLLRRVGQGGMSTVYLGYDPSTLSPVAVKLLAPPLAGASQFVERFAREGRLARELSHPNLVRGLGGGFDPTAGRHYVVLEFVDGPSCNAVLARAGRLPPGAAVQIGLDAGRGLAHLHARGYVHRDVKPDNILLHRDGRAKLADLGLAKRLISRGEPLTAAEQGVGTPQYMPLEQAANPALVDARSDVFALGATLFHLLTGRLPYPATTWGELVHSRTAAAPDVRDGGPDIPAPLAALLARAMAPDPRQRFRCAAELAHALEQTGLASPVPADLLTATGHPPDPPSDAPTTVAALSVR